MARGNGSIGFGAKAEANKLKRGAGTLDDQPHVTNNHPLFNCQIALDINGMCIHINT